MMDGSTALLDLVQTEMQTAPNLLVLEFPVVFEGMQVF